MSEMTVFKNPYKFIYEPIKWIKREFKCIKWAYQRITRGYSDYDLFSVDYTMGNLFEHMLRDLSQTAHGSPFNYPGGYDGWTKDLGHIADLWTVINKDLLDEEEWEDLRFKQQCAKREVFAFLEKYWYTLWD